MAPQQAITDFVILLDNPPDIIHKREELFHLHNGTIRLTPEEFDRYWPYMTNAYVHASHGVQSRNPSKHTHQRFDRASRPIGAQMSFVTAAQRRLTLHDNANIL